MYRLLAAACIVSLALAQKPSDLFEKAPPDVDEALRARLTQFFQYHVDGKFRQAEALVAEDSKDYYYNASKPRYLSFRIGRIEYSENFTKAKVTMVCKMFMPIIGFQDKPLDVPMPSQWRLEKGQWFWYVDPDAALQTPFGKMKPGTAPATGNSPFNASHMPTPEEIGKLLQQVRVDRPSVSLKAGAAQEVGIINQMPGVVKISINNPVGQVVDARLDRDEIKTGDRAVMSLRLKPGVAAPGRAVTIHIVVQQTNAMIPVQVGFE
jgi:hypothetical protein